MSNLDNKEHAFVEKMLISFTETFQENWRIEFDNDDGKTGLKVLINAYMTGLISCSQVQLNLLNEEEREQTIRFFIEIFLPEILSMYNVDTDFEQYKNQ